MLYAFINPSYESFFNILASGIPIFVSSFKPSWTNSLVSAITLALFSKNNYLEQISLIGLLILIGIFSIPSQIKKQPLLHI